MSAVVESEYAVPTESGELNEGFERLAPLRLVASEIQGTIENGRSRPLLVDGHDAANQRVAIVMKLRDPGVHDGTPWALCAVRDLVGSLIGARLGLPVPQAAIVELTGAFVRAAGGSAEGGRLARNVGLNFGSVRVERQLELPPNRPDLWQPILSFDAMCLNGDRKGGNPNVLWTGDALVPIDHGMIAPSWTFAIDGTSRSSLYGRVAIRTHAGAPSMRRRGLSFVNLADLWTIRITSEFLAWVRQQVPEQWATPEEVTTLLDFLAERHRIAHPQARELAEELMQ